MIKDNEIYHYCSLETLGKILEHKKLWLNDHRFFNDSLETRIGLFWFEQAMKEMVDNEQFIKTMQAIQKSKPYKIE